jgi:hypothetical protein
MERKTHFESDDDVEAYFEGQSELWDQPKPSPPEDLWQRIEQARLLKARQPVSLHHTIARPDLSRLEFPRIGSQRSSHRIKDLHTIKSVPWIRARPKKGHKPKTISSFPIFRDGT